MGRYKNLVRTQALDPGFSNHGSRPKIGSRRTLLWVSGTIMGRMGRRQICNTFIYLYNENIFDAVFFRKRNFFLYESNMGRGTYTDTDNWVAAKIS